MSYSDADFPLPNGIAPRYEGKTTTVDTLTYNTLVGV